ncbi:MAG: 4'-phosphopantetheinyl transferase superfamily protein [Desulfobacterales bacterium]
MALLNCNFSKNEIHIWQIDLDNSIFKTDDLIQVLSGDEIERAKRYHFLTDKKRFIVRRGLLRLILGSYLSTVPNDLNFYYKNNGKPAVYNELNKEIIKFNLSFSKGLALLGFTNNVEIGLDIEQMRNISEKDNIVLQLFSDKEKEIFSSSPQNQREEVFFTIWSRKEALIKATGKGLYSDLTNIDVSLTSDETVKMYDKSDYIEYISKWIVCDLEVESGFKAALAYPYSDCKIIHHQWDKHFKIVAGNNLNQACFNDSYNSQRLIY